VVTESATPAYTGRFQLKDGPDKKEVSVPKNVLRLEKGAAAHTNAKLGNDARLQKAMED
jgi:hypothetical protein